VSQYQKKHSRTHTYRGHQSSLICFLHLLRCMASSLFILRAWQSFSTISIEVCIGLPLGLAPPLHTPYSSSPNHCLLSAAHANTIATCFTVELRLYHLVLVSLSTLYLELSCSLTPHIRLTIFISDRWSATSFSFLTGQVSLPFNILLRTAVQSPSHYQWYILIGKQWYQLPEFIPSNSNSGLRSCIIISVYTQYVI